MATDLRPHIAAYANGTDEADRVRAKLAVVGAINAGQVEVQDLVQLLGGCLTSTGEQKRARGMRLLAEVLGTALASQLPEASAHHMLAFFCDRLKDAPCLSESLSGILALLRYREVSGPGGILVAQTMLAELAVQCGGQQWDRRSSG